MNPVGNLSCDECIDLMARTWYDREIIGSSPWSCLLDHACSMGFDDLHDEAVW